MASTVADTSWRVAVVGCGSIGKRHIRNLLELKVGHVVGVDPRPERRRDVAAALGIDTVSALAGVPPGAVDVAVITAPTSLHVPLALQAARRGCHLFIEKPLADDAAGLGELMAAVAGNDLVTLVGCNMRFHFGPRTIKALLDDGAVGRVIAARAEFGQYLPDWHPWEDYRLGYSARRELGGGIVLDAIHEIDYLRWMLGEVDTVACFGGKLSALEIDTEDVAAMLLRFASGAIGEIHVDYVQRVATRQCRIIGEEGTLQWDASTGEVRHYSAARAGWATFRPAASFDVNDMYVAEMEHFLACLERRECAQQDVAEGVRVLEVALAAKRSAATGQAVRLGGCHGA